MYFDWEDVPSEFQLTFEKQEVTEVNSDTDSGSDEDEDEEEGRNGEVTAYE